MIKKPKTPSTPTSLGETEYINVMINRKESRLRIINALSISDIIAQGLCSALHAKSKLVTLPGRFLKCNKIIFLSPQDDIPKS